MSLIYVEYVRQIGGPMPKGSKDFLNPNRISFAASKIREPLCHRCPEVFHVRAH